MRPRDLFVEVVAVVSLTVAISVTPQGGIKLIRDTHIETADAAEPERQPVSAAGATWVPSPQQSEPPPAGEDCSVIYDARRRRMILYGGKNDQNLNLNQTWVLDLTTGRWGNVTRPAPNPPPREDHTVIYDPVGDRMILYGGEADKGTENGTWSLDLKTMTWKDITSPGAPRREDHTAVYDSKRKRMVIYGGRDANDDKLVNLTTIHALDLDPDSPTYQRWTELRAGKDEEEKTPPGRVDHVAIYDSRRDRMVIFGGWDKKRKMLLNDTWAFSFDEMRWRAYAKKEKFHKPPQRRHAVAVYDDANNWMIVFGGLGEGLLNDIWAFALEVNEWINLTPGPKPRADHAAIFDPESRRVIIYGGEVVSGAPKLHDLWQLYVGKKAN